MPKQWRRHRHLRRWTTTKNKEAIRKFFEAFDRHDTERMGEFVSTAGYGFYFPTKPATDGNGHEQLIATIIKVYPDIHDDFEIMVAEGDKVGTGIKTSATHKVNFLGIPRWGKKVSLSASDFLSVRDAKFVEHWVDADLLG